MTKQNEKEPNFSSYVISDVHEINEDSDHYLYFRLDGAKFVMVVADKGEKVGPGESEIITVDHEEGTCPRCGSSAEEVEFCQFFTNHSVALFKALLPHSKNRLRWLSRHVFY